jgi:hypothetical protein
LRVEVTERKKTNSDLVKVLIDSVILAIKKIDTSMLSVQDIHDHLAVYTTFSEIWRSKNYIFEFVGCINSVLKNIFWMNWANLDFIY